MTKERQHSPTPPGRSNGGQKQHKGAWEFSAIPWTFPLDQAQTVSEGWEPFAVHTIPSPEVGPNEYTTCLIVRRPA